MLATPSTKSHPVIAGGIDTLLIRLGGFELEVRMPAGHDTAEDQAKFLRDIFRDRGVETKLTRETKESVL